MRCLRRGDESEEESNGGCGKAPACCVFVATTERRPACGPGSMVSTLLDDVRCCNGTMAAGPALRWSSRCGAVRASRFPID